MVRVNHNNLQHNSNFWKRMHLATTLYGIWKFCKCAITTEAMLGFCFSATNYYNCSSPAAFWETLQGLRERGSFCVPCGNVCAGHAPSRVGARRTRASDRGGHRGKSSNASLMWEGLSAIVLSSIATSFQIQSKPA